LTMTTREEPTKARRFDTFLLPVQIAWLRRTALEETQKRGYEVTAAKILREMIDEKRNEKN
jgi:hypothetical protein